MTNALIGLPVGATSLENAEQTFTLSGKDGTIPVFALFCGDEFVGKTVGWEEFINTGGTFNYNLSAGKLSITQYSDAVGTARNWGLSACGKILKVSGLIIEVEMNASVSSIASDWNEIAFALGDVETHDPLNGILVQLSVGAEVTAGEGDGTAFKIFKREAGTWSTLYDSGKGTITNCWWKIEYSDNTWTVSLKTGTATTYTQVYSGTDWLTTNLLFPMLRCNDKSGISVTFTLDAIKIIYPSFSIAYDQSDSDVNKGDVKVYDTKGQTDESLWQQVFNTDHPFTGDCVIENGIIRVKWPLTSSGRLSLLRWTGTEWTSSIWVDQDWNEFVTTNFKLLKITPEEVSCQGIWTVGTRTGTVKVSLKRGLPFIEFETLDGNPRIVVKPASSLKRFGYSYGDTGDTFSDFSYQTQHVSTYLDNWVTGFNTDPCLMIYATAKDGTNWAFKIVHPHIQELCKNWIGIIPLSQVTNFFKEAEGITIVGGETNIVRDDFTDDSSASYTDLAGTMSFQTEGSASDSFTGDGSTKTFQLTYYPIVPDSQTVKVDGATQTEDTDYSINDGTGELTFTTPPASGAVIEVTYTKRGCCYSRASVTASTAYRNYMNALKFGSGTYEADLCISSTTAEARQALIAFGLTDARNHYQAGIRMEADGTCKLRLGKHVAGPFYVIDEDIVSFTIGEFCHVKVEWDASVGTIKVYWKDETTPRISVTDTSFTDGYCGFIGHVGGAGELDSAFDNLYINAEEVLSSGNKAVVLDAQDDRILHTLVAGTDIPYGRYLWGARVKDTANIANDVYLVIWNATEGKSRKKERKTVTNTYDFYVTEVEIREAYEAGDTLSFEVKKYQTTDNRIVVDYVFLMPLSNALNFPMDIAHSSMREVAVGKLKIKEK